MSIPAPDFDPENAVPENVDNTNVIHRALVQQMTADAGTDVTAVVEQLAADGRIADTDVDAAVEKGWTAAKDVEAVKGRIGEAKARPVLDEVAPVEEAPVKGG